MRELIIVRGGGDVATGTIWTLRRAGFPVLVLECAYPSSIRRTVSFSEAVYEGETSVEGMVCRLAADPEEAVRMLRQDGLAVLVDPDGTVIPEFEQNGRFAETFPCAVLVDGILAKKNLGTKKNSAPFVIALGPGFTAGQDCDAVVETMRGHNLARVIRNGPTLPDTGVPGVIAGHAEDRVLHAAHAGIIHNRARIGDSVAKDQIFAVIAGDDGAEYPVRACFPGLLRGLIRDGFYVTKGFKIADVDPRKEEYRNCFTISDKARAIGGAVLMTVMEYLHGRDGNG